MPLNASLKRLPGMAQVDVHRSLRGAWPLAAGRLVELVHFVQQAAAFKLSDTLQQKCLGLFARCVHAGRSCLIIVEAG